MRGYELNLLAASAMQPLQPVRQDAQASKPLPDWDELLKPVRPPLDEAAMALSDKERDELIGPVKSVRLGFNFVSTKTGECAGECSYYQTNIYDMNGKKVSEKGESLCGFSSLEKYIYDTKGRVIERITYNWDGLIHDRVLFVYDSFGKLSELSSYNGDGELQGRSQYLCDLSGNVIESYSYDGDGQFKSRSFYLYEVDSWGNWIECVEYPVRYDDKSEKGAVFVQCRAIEYFN